MRFGIMMSLGAVTCALAAFCGGCDVISNKFTNLADHQEQVDYYEALMTSMFEEFKHKTGDPEPWDFARYLAGHPAVRIRGLKSNFDELSYWPLTAQDDFGIASCRSYWQKPLAGYLSLLFGK